MVCVFVGWLCHLKPSLIYNMMFCLYNLKKKGLSAVPCSRFISRIIFICCGSLKHSNINVFEGTRDFIRFIKWFLAADSRTILVVF